MLHRLRERLRAKEDRRAGTAFGAKRRWGLESGLPAGIASCCVMVSAECERLRLIILGMAIGSIKRPVSLLHQCVD